MKTIKVSTPWSHIDFRTRIGNINDSGYEFIFDEDSEHCDFWIVWGGIKGVKEKAVCNPGNVIYLTDEAHEQRLFNKSFLNQFAAVITCRKDIEHKLVIHTHELNTWMIDKTYDWLYSNEQIPKSKNLSVVCSDQTWLPGHKLRFAFVNKLIGHFKDKIDVFGRGFNPIQDKFNALAEYKYSVAIENSVIPGYFTEKITDCYLADAMPVYYGCPDIDTYFDPNSLLLIDPYDLKTSVDKIEQMIGENWYEKKLPLLINEKRKYLEDYHIFNKLIKILDKEFRSGEKKRRITIVNEQSFEKGYSIKKLINKTVKKLHFK
ncbi:MAG TPA: glycosyltransferase family 10 [Puia sp.]